MRAHLVLTAEGKVQAVKMDYRRDEVLRPAIEKSLAKWQFAPARRQGQPVAAEVAMDIIVSGATRPI